MSSPLYQLTDRNTGTATPTETLRTRIVMMTKGVD